MTERHDDKPKTHKKKSFKEQILADLQEARQLRQQQHLAEQVKEAAAKSEVQDNHDSALANKTDQSQLFDEDTHEVKCQLEEKAQSALAENRIQTEVERSSIDEALETIQQAFTPETLEKQEQESYFVRATDGVGSTGMPDIPIEMLYEEDSSEDSQETDNSFEPEPESPAETEEHLENTVGRKRQRTDNLAKRIALVLITVIIIALGATGFFVYHYVDSAIKPLDKTSIKYITVDIPEGSGNKYIGQILEKAGVIKSATVFNYYTKFKNYSNFQSGYYNLQPSMDLDEICSLLKQGGTAEPEKPALGKILIPEGYTIKQISEAITKNKADKDALTPFSSDDFLNVVQDENFIAKMVEKYPRLLGDLPSADQATYRLEGYLFPATYSYYKETSMEDLVEQMIVTMDSYMSSYYDTIAAKGMTVNEVLTLASLVEKEGSTDEDRRNIASVFYNRLNAGMPLQSNIAILYAMGKLGEETTLEADASIDTGIDSPYNIYTHTGLMPGPVDNPGLSAIEAVINPATTNYYYFVADVKTGNVYYSENYDDHEKNVHKYVNSQLSE